MFQYKQDDRHDWLGDAAEAYVKYCFACEGGFEIFSAGKWTPDVVVRDTAVDKWWRIEVKSTTKEKGTINRPSLSNLAKKADVLAEVRFLKEKGVRLTLVKLSAVDHWRRLTISGEGHIRAFLYDQAAKSS